ncbi:hypothetical protein JHW43_009468, partial [Diplocarpon mali]
PSVNYDFQYAAAAPRSFAEQRLPESHPQHYAIQMAGAQQYNFPPPPPPPGGPPSNHSQQLPQYGYAQQQPQYQQPPRGGGLVRGRGGVPGGRGDFHGNQPYNPQQPNGGYNPQGQGLPHGQGPPDPKHQVNRVPKEVVMEALNGRTLINMINTMVPNMALPNNTALLSTRPIRNNHQCNTLLSPLLCSPITTIQTTHHKLISHRRSRSRNHSMVRNKLLPSSSRMRKYLLMVRVGQLMAGLRSGKVLLKMPDPLSIVTIVGVAVFKVAVVVMKHLSWVHQFAWDLIMIEEVTWLKRALPSISTQVTPHPLRTLSHSTSPILEITLMGDSVHHLIPTRSTRVLTGVKDTRISKAEVAAITTVAKVMAAIIMVMVAKVESAGAESNGKKKKKRRTNTLGLTPNGVDHEDSEDEIDDADEEARLVTLLGPDTPQIPTDLDDWLAERRARFPTKARREAAAEELRQRREQQREARQKSQQEKSKKEEGESKLEKQQRKAEKLRLELEKAERKIQESMQGGSKRKRENGDEGDDDRQGSEYDSDASSGSESGDSKPEAASSRQNAPYRMAQTPKAQLQRHCKYFSTGGTCGKKGKCRFVHDQEVRNQALRDKDANGGKMTLAQRLILNDTAKDDLTILKSIKYLKEKGLMPEQLTGGATRQKSEESGYAENLNYGDN